ncbi:hypothetical protein SARC_11869 [Sphaeroforma arctica JP610]|uniref:Uncharacterized protein n=1 Tax=Sphaeroforma arctica JP610 TaxID=667725 RepID=A0A0L0FHW9_9EUKA|nr:hypothetical protein SARC_11869 [Sphaeroforma arctica JP610]KNC75608.1 hypothetical protein SARC_11869 [Sphaeroforma arctica JP610]|eukprot:XP_014149510.1 hypothetical protein SARC_11869 [Sphaeroforma arctica JP610]
MASQTTELGCETDKRSIEEQRNKGDSHVKAGSGSPRSGTPPSSISSGVSISADAAGPVAKKGGADGRGSVVGTGGNDDKPSKTQNDAEQDNGVVLMDIDKLADNAVASCSDDVDAMSETMVVDSSSEADIYDVPASTGADAERDASGDGEVDGKIGGEEPAKDKPIVTPATQVGGVEAPAAVKEASDAESGSQPEADTKQGAVQVIVSHYADSARKKDMNENDDVVGKKMDDDGGKKDEKTSGTVGVASGVATTASGVEQSTRDANQVHTMDTSRDSESEMEHDTDVPEADEDNRASSGERAVAQPIPLLPKKPDVPLITEKDEKMGGPKSLKNIRNGKVSAVVSPQHASDGAATARPEDSGRASVSVGRANRISRLGDAETCTNTSTSDSRKDTKVMDSPHADITRTKHPAHDEAAATTHITASHPTPTDTDALDKNQGSPAIRQAPEPILITSAPKAIPIAPNPIRIGPPPAPVSLKPRPVLAPRGVALKRTHTGSSVNNGHKAGTPISQAPTPVIIGSAAPPPPAPTPIPIGITKADSLSTVRLGADEGAGSVRSNSSYEEAAVGEHRGHPQYSLAGARLRPQQSIGDIMTCGGLRVSKPDDWDRTSYGEDRDRDGDKGGARNVALGMSGVDLTKVPESPLQQGMDMSLRMVKQELGDILGSFCDKQKRCVEFEQARLARAWAEFEKARVELNAGRKASSLGEWNWSGAGPIARVEVPGERAARVSR